MEEPREHSRFPHLFSSLALRSVTLRNRAVLLPMGIRFAHNGTPNEGDFAFYKARARGGVGLIITGGTPVHVNGTVRARDLYEPFNPDALPALARLVGEIHAEDVPVIGQLYHRGRLVSTDSDWPTWGPSAIASLATGDATIPHAMTIGEVEEMIDAYASSASALMSCGFDGIEIHGAHGYLVTQFLSASSNQRDDRYGGTPENRMRFLLDIVAAVRTRIGSRAPLGVRLTADEGEHVVDGIRLPYTEQIAKALAATGEVDYISVAIGIRGGYVKDMSTPVGPALPHAEAVRRASGLPVIASQRITHPSLAEKVLAEGGADMIGMARALIADWEWVAKARDGRVDEIRPCIGCLQVCRSGIMGCVHSPTSGRETTYPPWIVTRAERSRRIVVVGGGPAGLEAAVQAATRGHRVVLFEADRKLGGQACVAALAPHRTDVDGVIAYRALELARLGVDVRVGRRVDAEAIVAEAPDAVVLATGAVPLPLDGIDGAESPHVIDVVRVQDPDECTETLLASSRHAVVIDNGHGFWESCSAAEALAVRGIGVTFVTPARSIAAGLPAESIGPLHRRLRWHDVTILPMHRVSEVRAQSVSVFDTVRVAATSILEEKDVPADVVVHFSGKRVVTALAGDLSGRVREVHLAGDCLAPRRINHAVLDGYRVGRAL